MYYVKEMHYRRTCLLVEYEDANRALDKAKPHKKSAVCIQSSLILRKILKSDRYVQMVNILICRPKKRKLVQRRLLILHLKLPEER